MWDKSATGEFRGEVVDGRQAIRVAATQGPNAAQFVLRPDEVPGNPAPTNQSYRLRIEYHTDPGAEGYVHAQTHDENYAIIGRVVLKNQGPGWHTATASFKPEGKNFQIAIGSTRTAPGKFISISSFELIPEFVRPNDKLIYTLDLARVEPFRFKQQDGQPSDTDWRNKVPVGVYLHCWKKESVAEFRGEVSEGRPSIGVVNLNDNISSQILFQCDAGLGVPLRVDETYRVRMEYRMQNDAEGQVDVRNPHDNDYPSIANARLEPTDGKWRTVELTFRRPPNGTIDVCFVNNAVGEGNTLSVRSMEVYEVAK